MTHRTEPPPRPPPATPGLPIEALADATHVPVERLRAWREEYGFPVPYIVEGDVAFYRLRDVAAVATVQAWVRDGVTVRAAIDRYRGLGARPRPPDQPAIGPHFKAALLRCDLEAAAMMFDDIVLSFDIVAAMERVIAPALQAVGDAWHNDELGVAHEHAVSTFVRDRVGRLIWNDPKGGGTVVAITTPPGERHEIGALGVAAVLARAGFHVVFVGPDTPIDDLRVLVATTRAAAVVISATMEEHVRPLGDDAYRGVAPAVVMGGAAIGAPSMAERVGAVYAGTDLAGLPQMLTDLVVETRRDK